MRSRGCAVGSADRSRSGGGYGEGLEWKALEVFGGINADGLLVREHDADAQTSLEPTELLETLALLQRGGGKALYRREDVGAEGVEPDVLEEGMFLRPRPFD